MLTEGQLLLLCYASGVLAMMLAMGRDRNPVIWLVAAIVSGPVAVLLLFMLPRSARDPAADLDREMMELCDTCLEPVRRDRDACRHCGAAGEPPAKQPENSLLSPPA